MKKLIFILSLACSTSVIAQIRPTTHYASFELGTGLNFGFNDDAYRFKIGGMVQPYLAYDKYDGEEAEYYLNSKRTYFNIAGLAVNEKVGFFLQLDFSRVEPMMDAYLSYYATDRLTIDFGQKQNITNNREMLIMEDKLTFPDRSLVSTSYSRTGREFGLFADYRLGNDSWAVIPQVSITSGDGRNSFGADSRDVDYGGMKYGGRLDVYPLGMFTDGNRDYVADLMHEEKVKFVVGGAFSYNDGASDAVGEGHGNFELYDANGDVRLPDYRQLYGDILLKYKGFSLLGEYVVATATSLDGMYTSNSGELLMPTQISQYLALGSGYNVQLGYATKEGYAVDFRYSVITPEFEDNIESVIQDQTGWTAGLGKYWKGNALKTQLAFSSYDIPDGTNYVLGQFMIQAIF